MGLRLDNTVEMVRLFEPMGGTFAALVFAIVTTYFAITELLAR